MGEFLTRLTSFFNFQKTANVSAPGLIAAGAVFLFFFSAPPQHYDQVDRIFSKESVDLMGFSNLSKSCEVLSYDWHAKGGIGGRLLSDDWTTLQQRRNYIDDCTYTLQQRIITDLKTIAQTSAQVEAEQKLLTSLAKRQEDELLSGQSFAKQTQRQVAEIEGDLSTKRADAKRAETRVAFYNSVLPRLGQEAKEIAQIVHAGDNVEPFEAVATRFGTNFMAFVLFAIVCGVVIDPIMALIQPVLYTDKRMRRLNAAVQGVRVAPREANLTAYSLNYARGLGLLTDADIEALMRQYLYPSQMLLNLIVAGALFLPAAGLFLKTHWVVILRTFS
jgi:hypothetical protein